MKGEGGGKRENKITENPALIPSEYSKQPNFCLQFSVHIFEYNRMNRLLRRSGLGVNLSPDSNLRANHPSSNIQAKV